ncbi:MSMEG_0570 family nitrogen starvation response protein [Ancylobacter sp. MQZ15Z-1]|uniref:MSMEG_0570 family nitrogen starvation response protein n=1 Tax=Ancylobacter mangrovi TaxID=2972472 RepID=A0A9X2PGX4_9HYPH|nr:MSMEG_0570 family nitrogen starvation response protein [Ancylobacter mangrovi]MCS0496861.1 MSMEG_0570 family nitrogen starvation response protein [Ancylobacter mangrovi]
MPEMLFSIRWPDGQAEQCYSPSLVIKDFLQPGCSYPLDEFLSKSREALNIASQRVEARYGMPCSRALGQLARIESAGQRYLATPDARVTVESFTE